MNLLRSVSFLAAMIAEASHASIVSVRDYGAAGDGRTFDQAAFIAAATAVSQSGGGTVAVPRGIYLLDRTAGKSAAVALQRITNVAFEGESGCTELRLNPEGQYSSGQDVHILQLDNCNGVTVQGLDFNGSKAAYAAHDEQMHGIHIVNSSGISVMDCRFRDMRGDGIFVMGNLGLTDGLTVAGCSFFGNGRSGIANQGGIRNVTYEDNLFFQNSDQDIDFEPSGTRPPPYNVWVRRNTILHNHNSTICLTLGGQPFLGASNIFASDNHIEGKVRIFRMDGCEFTGNSIVVTNTKGGGALEIQDACTGVLVERNTIRYSGEYVVYVAHHTSGDVTIRDNTIHQTGIGYGVLLYGTGSGIDVSNNSIIGTATASKGIMSRIPVNDHLTRGGYVFTGNCISGFKEAMRVVIQNAETIYEDMRIENNVWLVPVVLPGMRFVTFEVGSRSNVPAGDAVVQPTVLGNVVREY